MADLPVGECALAGPRFIARNPTVIGIWFAVQLAISIGLSLLMIATMGPQLQAITRMSDAGAGQSNPQEVLRVFAGILPGYATLLLFSLVIYAVIYGAMNRAVLRPDDRGFAYLRVGGDELRQGLLVLVYAVLSTFLYIACIIVGSIIVALLSVAGSPILSGLATLVVFLAALGLFIFLGVRLSLSSALTFDTGKLNIFGGWGLSRGQFWPMLSVYLLCLVQVVLLAIIGGVIMWLVLTVLVPGGGVLQFFTKPDMTSVGAMLSPARLVYAALGALLTVVIFPICLMSGPAMYRALTTGRRVGEVFS